jgi:lysophospholipase L1-like esterase
LRELATEAGVPYLGAGVSGSRIDQWIDSAWMQSSLDQLDPTLVLVSLGTNDAYSDFSAEQIVEHMRSLLARIPEEAEVVWIGVPGLPATYGGRSPKVETLEAIESEAPYYYESHELEIPRGPDGLHPTAFGYAGWAGALWDWLT